MADKDYKAVKLTWNGEAAMQAVREGAYTGIVRAGVILETWMKNIVGEQGGFGDRSKPGQPPRVDQNTLRKSIQSVPSPSERVVRVGTNNPEGRWMEFGANVKPKAGKYLTVPINKKAADLSRNLAGKSLKTLKFGLIHRGNKMYMIEQTPKGKIKKNPAVFALRSNVRILPRPWVQRSVDRARSEMQQVFTVAVKQALNKVAKK